MYVHQVMGVCCIVFDIDGILYEFLKYWKKENFKIIIFQYFMFSSRFMLFPTFKIKYFCVFFFKFPGGGGGVKNNYFSFHFAFYAISNI